VNSRGPASHPSCGQHFALKAKLCPKSHRGRSTTKTPLHAASKGAAPPQSDAKNRGRHARLEGSLYCGDGAALQGWKVSHYLAKLQTLAFTRNAIWGEGLSGRAAGDRHCAPHPGLTAQAHGGPGEAQGVPPAQGHVFVCVDFLGAHWGHAVPPPAGNIGKAAGWALAHGGHAP
jgi:hypothetical protein